MSHIYCNLMVHVVFSTKHRQRFILELVRERLYAYLGGIAREEFGEALAIGGMPDHVHGLLSLRGSAAVSDAVCK